jgi:hypothetical protein
VKVIFIAGPLTPSAGLHPVMASRVLFENTERAKDMAKTVMSLGAIPIVPHMNTGWALRKVDEAIVRAGYRTILSRCDAVLMLPGWTDSQGALAEHQAAIDLGIPIFWPATMDLLVKFLKGAADGKPKD